MVGALHLGDAAPTGEGARRLDGRHHRLGTGVDETDPVEAGRAPAEVLRQVDFDLGGQGEGGAPLQLIGNRGNDGREGVAVDQRGHVVGEV